jgi:L-alanine-DL-glutamate epimerase-like enolase superfamily enzyme
VELSARKLTLRLAETFTISRSSQDEAEVVQVELARDGHVGYGEAAPIERYDESAESAVSYLEQHADVLGNDPFALDDVLERLPREQFAARAAVDAALHDLQGKLTGLAVYRLLGLRRGGPPTSWTIWLGDPDDMARRAECVSARGRFRRLKLKLGGRDGLDIDRVRSVRGVTELPLQVDVNEYWALEEAVENIGALSELGVQYVEQPLRARDPDGPELKRRARLPVFVDEDCHTLDDVATCAERAHGITIKLAKSGGLREAMRMAHAARALGLGVMLGCMVESGLGIAPGAHIASLCDHVDLDGNLLLAEDPSPGIELVDGVQLPPDAPGLGVRVGVAA